MGPLKLGRAAHKAVGGVSSVWVMLIWRMGLLEQGQEKQRKEARGAGQSRTFDVTLDDPTYLTTAEGCLKAQQEPLLHKRELPGQLGHISAGYR